MLNNGKKLAELYGESAYTAYRLARSLLIKGVVSKHLIVPLEALPTKISIAILSKHQKTKDPCFKVTPPTITRYYSYAGNPVEIYYLLGDCSTVLDNVNASKCHLELCENLLETLVPLEKPDVQEITMFPLETPRGKFQKLDALDVSIALDVFRLNNPPFKNTWRVKELINTLEKRLGIKGVRYHYYEHIHKLVHYTVKGDGSFVLLLVYSSTRRELEAVVNELLNKGFIAGTWQAHCISKVPLTALVYAWGYVNKFVEPGYVHESVSNTSYTLYPVIGVGGNAPRA